MFLLYKYKNLTTLSSLAIVTFALISLLLVTITFLFTWFLFALKIFKIDYMSNIDIDLFTLFTTGLLLTFILDKLTKLILRNH